MKNFPYFGPGLVVLVAGGVALVAAPMVVRRVNDERATAQIVQASHVLAESGGVKVLSGAEDDGVSALSLIHI